MSFFDIIILNDMFCGHDLIKIYLVILTISLSVHYCSLSKHRVEIHKSIRPSSHYIHSTKLKHPFLTRMKELKDQERKLDTDILHSYLQVLNDRTKADLLKLRGSLLTSYSKAGKPPGKYRNAKHRFRRNNEDYNGKPQILENIAETKENN